MSREQAIEWVRSEARNTLLAALETGHKQHHLAALGAMVLGILRDTDEADQVDPVTDRAYDIRRAGEAWAIRQRAINLGLYDQGRT